MSRAKPTLVSNYCTNVEEILRLVEQESHKFSSREPGAAHEFSTQYGDSRMKTLFYFNMSDELKLAIFKTIPDDIKRVSSFCINKYEPGDYLRRHKDSAGAYWKFKLVFLQSDRPHFKWYDRDNNGHLVREEPGALLEMPIDLEHEVTLIEADETPKYSLVLAWSM